LLQVFLYYFFDVFERWHAGKGRLVMPMERYGVANVMWVAARDADNTYCSKFDKRNECTFFCILFVTSFAT